MIWIDILFALAIGLIVTMLLVMLTSRKPERGGVWLIFFIIFLGTLAAGRWMRPIGPPVYDFYWVPGLIVAVLFALLLAATLPDDKNRENDRRKDFPAGNATPDKPGFNPRDADPKRDYVEPSQKDNQAVMVASGIFWVVLIILLIGVIAGYFL